MKVIDNKRELMDELAQGSFVITPNNRLSASMTEDYFHYANLPTVDKPHCLPYLSFIHYLYQQWLINESSLGAPRLLHGHQSRYLWQKILRSQEHLTYSKGLLNAVIEAWSRCVQWHISPHDPAFNHSLQCQQFQQWWQLFNQQLAGLNAITEEQLSDYLITSQTSLLEQKMIWASFDDFTPQQRRLQHCLAEQGVAQYTYDLSSKSTNSFQFAAHDHENEFQQLIQWLHERMKAGDQKIGVVVPDLQQRSHTLGRQLKRFLSPELFNLSLGKPLQDYPLIAHGLSWLGLSTDQITHEQARLILYSPYLKGAKQELHQRVQIIEDSPLLQEKSLPLSQWIHHINSKAPQLADCLKQLSPYPESASPQQWVEFFHQRLQTLGYPGDYGLNSENYQCFHRFTELFNHFRQINFITEKLSAHEAINHFTDLVGQTIFQAQSTSKKPVQISGLLEASGCEFDSLWIMGLTDQCLPQKTQLSSFIPHTLQREHHMPHSSPERELQFAQKNIQRFKQASAYNLFSYPKMSGDTPNLVSPLISDLPKYLPPEVLPDTTHGLALESMEEDYLIPLLADEQTVGGTALLANQAKCPFRAFAAHRLHAKATNGLTEGFDSRERGQIIHKVMELIWRQLGSQQQLLSMKTNVLDDCIESAISTALSPFMINKNQNIPELFKQVEVQRLKRLVHSCLEWEKQRPPFEVEALEEEYNISLSQLNFKIRVDRLDKVDQNKQWVIDYKSSIPSSRPWNEDRPKEPQLLLYALLNESINTLMFIQLKAGQIESKSFSEDKLDIKGNSSLKKGERWDEYKQHWRQQLELLAKEFSEGHCPPQPLNLTICEQCDFQSLCRFSEGK